MLNFSPLRLIAVTATARNSTAVKLRLPMTSYVTLLHLIIFSFISSSGQAARIGRYCAVHNGCHDRIEHLRGSAGHRAIRASRPQVRPISHRRMHIMGAYGPFTQSPPRGRARPPCTSAQGRPCAYRYVEARCLIESRSSELKAAGGTVHILALCTL